MIDEVINLFLVVGTLAALLGASLYVFLTKRYRYWRDRGVPGPEAEFFYGNTRELIQVKVTKTELNNKFYWQFKTEEYVGYYNLWQKVILIRDLDLIKKVTEKDFNHFHDHIGFTSYAKTDTVFSNLFSQKVDIWKKRREVFSKLFTPKKLKDYYEDMQGNALDLMEELESAKCQDLQFNLVLRKCIVCISCMIFFGIDLSKDDATIAKFIEKAEVFATPPASTVVKMAMASILPSIFKTLKIQIFPTDVYYFFSNLVKEISSARTQGDVDRGDLFDIIMKMMEGEKMGFNEAVGQSFLFFQASFDTMELTTCHTLLQLALHPNVQETLREEIDCVTKGSQTITYEQLSQMNYLDAVINESMRINPPIGVLDRVCNKPYKVNEKLTIPEGTVVMIPVLSLQMDPAYYPEPEKFKPERFYDSKNDSKKTPLLPFGAGPRICIGMRLGKLVVKLVLANIISRFLVLQSEKMTLPMKFETKTLLFSAVPIGGFWLKLEKRGN